MSEEVPPMSPTEAIAPEVTKPEEGILIVDKPQANAVFTNIDDTPAAELMAKAEADAIAEATSAPASTEPTAAPAEICGAKLGRRFPCILSKGHVGDHEAKNEHGPNVTWGPLTEGKRNALEKKIMEVSAAESNAPNPPATPPPAHGTNTDTTHRFCRCPDCESARRGYRV